MSNKFDMYDVLCKLEGIVAVFDIVNDRLMDEVGVAERCKEVDRNALSKNFVSRSSQVYLPALCGIHGDLVDLLGKVEEATDG